ncbi:MAG TPA: tRNA lysidine(34) synthetase TilS [Bacteroidales bacterium]|nr:tRNA lysidine(34) synthetase TilS [Bacteroidales bacterium]
MLPEFQKFIEDNRLISHGERVLLAVSGGIDSMVMAHLFLRMNYHIGVAHCNFSLRGNESDLDEKLVKDFASANGIPFFSVRFNTKDYAHEHGLSVQMAARDLRYSWFEELRQKEGFSSIAVAHNLNDNAETVLINLTRGTGIAGLTGMRPRKGKIIRPLLFATREKIRLYCEENRVNYREDRSNAETKYTRNKIRHLVLPVLKEINPSAEYSINETAIRLSELTAFIDEFLARIREELIVERESLKVFNLKSFAAYRHNRTLIFELFKEFGLTGTQVPELEKLIESQTGSVLFTSTYRFLRNRDEILITARHEDNDDEAEVYNDPQSIANSRLLDYAESREIDSSFTIPREKSVACIDECCLKFPVIIRKWKQGDYFYPLGMKHRRKLSDYFVDRKLSLAEKEKLFVLESDGRIAWIIGERLDERFRIMPKTKNVIILKARTSLRIG